MTNHSPQLGMMLGFMWQGLWSAVVLVFLLTIYALVIFPAAYLLERLRRRVLRLIPNFDANAGYFRLRYHRRVDPLAGGWNLDIDVTLLGGGFVWRSIEWQGYVKLDLGWKWLVRFCAGGSDDRAHRRFGVGLNQSHHYVSLGLLSFHLDIGRLGKDLRVRLFRNGRRLFYRSRYALA
uniref:Uncharacterized protein n=1 Tax=Caulobacter phage BL57 TaxID=3348355 RepID=A0AB74UL95_9VIRU